MTIAPPKVKCVYHVVGSIMLLSDHCGSVPCASPPTLCVHTPSSYVCRCPTILGKTKLSSVADALRPIYYCMSNSLCEAQPEVQQTIERQQRQWWGISAGKRKRQGQIHFNSQLQRLLKLFVQPSCHNMCQTCRPLRQSAVSIIKSIAFIHFLFSP